MENKYILSEQISLYGEADCIGFGNDEFYIKEIPKKISNEIIIKNHYSKKVAGFATTYIYLGVFEKDVLLGSLQFGYAMNAASQGSVVENTSIFWELDGETYHNKAMTIKDKSKSNSKEKFLQENKERAVKSELRQFRYIKFINQKWKKKCLLKEMPYPKHYKL